MFMEINITRGIVKANHYAKLYRTTPYVEWVRSEIKEIKNMSIVWKALVFSFSLAGNWLALKVGDGESIRVGLIHGYEVEESSDSLKI
jgi:hypothetical protein